MKKGPSKAECPANPPATIHDDERPGFMTEHILVIEDEADLRMTLSDRLKGEGYVPECAIDGDQGLNKALAGSYDLIILDVMLPRKNGFDVCRDIRKAGLTVPIIMLTARGQLVDKVLGLKIGADDYLTKPFEMLELLARIEALLRRGATPPAEPSGFQQFGSIQIDFRGTTVFRGGAPVPLSAREFRLLRYFVQNRGATLSREVLLKDVWGYSEDTFTRTVDVHVGSLRQKLEADPKQPTMIVTVPGLGYKFTA
jgi:DNA-binding response OmpR family regulator